MAVRFPQILQFDPVAIRPARSAADRRTAARLLCTQEPPEARESTRLRLLERGPRDGWFIAWRYDEPIGCVLADEQAGRVGSIWVPRFAERVDQLPLIAGRLLTQAIDYLNARGVNIIQSQLESGSGSDAALLRAAGFEMFCELLYLSSTTPDFPTSPPAEHLEFEAYRPSNRARLLRVVEETYRETQDCPRLNGVRNVSDVLDGYQASGEFDQKRWFIVRHGLRDVGCLLLTAYRDPHVWELIYQGIVPWARGRGFGTDVTRHAQWLTGQAGVDQLVLAVDSANDPGLGVYAAAGFRAWESRWVFARTQSQAVARAA